MARDPDFEVLYSEAPSKVRSNANLPGDLVYVGTKLTNHSTYIEKMYESLERAFPGYGKDWTWQDFGIPERWNPTKELITPYFQLSRSEAMKGSEQVVRSFNAVRASEIEGAGIAPDLRPRALPVNSPQTIINVAQQGRQEIKQRSAMLRKVVGLASKE